MENKEVGAPTQPKYVGLIKAELPTITALMKLNAQEGTNVEAMAQQELEYLRMQAISKPEIAQCIPATVVFAVKTAIKQNLSLDPYAGLVYIKTRNVKIGEDYHKALEIMPTANGLISIARQCGRILDIKRPNVKKDNNGKVISVSVEYAVPSFNGGRWETVEFDESDFYRWKRASHTENGRFKKDADANKLNYANPNYTNFNGGIDPEFARAKAIRHGLKKLGTNMNERVMTKIVEPSIKEIIIDQKADEQASNDEATSHEVNQGFADTSNGFADAEVISETRTHTITTVENITIPNSNDL